MLVKAHSQDRLGDFEDDSIFGKNHQSELIILGRLKEMEMKIPALPHRKARRVVQAFKDKLHAEHVLKMTFKNGKEFTDHKTIAQR